MNIILYTLILLVPLPFASARPVWQWIWVVHVALSGLLYLYWARKRPSPQLPPPFWFAVITGIVLALWGFVQTLPLLEGGKAISANVVATHDFSLFVLAHIMWLVVVAAFAAPRRSGRTAGLRARQLIFFFAMTGVAYAAYGLIVYMLGNDQILWFKKEFYTDSLTSTFVNRNNYAAYCGLALQCLAAHMLYRFRISGGAWGEGAFGHEAVRFAWYCLGAFLLVSALFLTGSRAGVFTSLLGLGLLLLWGFQMPRAGVAPQAGKGGWRILAFAAAFVVALVLVYSLSGSMLDERLAIGTGDEGRFRAFAHIMRAIEDRPYAGFGLGTFEEVFRGYRGLDIHVVFDRAHSEYLELAMTAGIPMAVLVCLAALLVCVYFIFATRASARHAIYVLLGLTTSIQILTHAVIDFPVQIPAVAYSYLLVVGCAFALAPKAEKPETRRQSSGRRR